MKDYYDLKSVPVPRIEGLEIPFGVKYTRAVNFIQMALLVVLGILLAVLVVSRYYSAAAENGTETNPMMAGLAGLIAFSFGLIPAILLGVLNSELGKLSLQARFWQVIVSCLLMLEFPLGTVLYGLALYFLLGDEETRAAFEDGPAQAGGQKRSSF